jgi:hypothetical protein
VVVDESLSSRPAETCETSQNLDGRWANVKQIHANLPVFSIRRRMFRRSWLCLANPAAAAIQETWAAVEGKPGQGFLSPHKQL